MQSGVACVHTQRLRPARLAVVLTCALPAPRPALRRRPARHLTHAGCSPAAAAPATAVRARSQVRRSAHQHNSAQMGQCSLPLQLTLARRTYSTPAAVARPTTAVRYSAAGSGHTPHYRLHPTPPAACAAAPTSASSASVSSCRVSARLARSAYSRPAARAASSLPLAAATAASAAASSPARRSDSCSARESAACSVLMRPCSSHQRQCRACGQVGEGACGRSRGSRKQPAAIDSTAQP